MQLGECAEHCTRARTQRWQQALEHQRIRVLEECKPLKALLCPLARRAGVVQQVVHIAVAMRAWS